LVAGRTELNFPNPVVTRADLFGRDRELSLIEAVLGSSIQRPIIIQAERVIGKTSLLNVVAEWALNSGLSVLHLPHVTSRDQLIEEILDGMAAESHTSLYRLGLRGNNGELTLTTMSSFVQAATELAGQAAKTFLLCLDELDSMLRRCPDERSAEQILDFVQHVVTRTALPLKFICTTTRTVSQILGSDAGHFMQGSRIAELRPWSEEESRDFVDRIVGDTLVEDEAHVVIHQLCGGHPYLTKAILQAFDDGLADVPTVTERGGTAEPATLTPLVVRRAADAALRSPEVAFTLNNIVTAHFSAEERATLLHAARAGDALLTPTPHHGEPIHALAIRGYLRRMPDGTYRQAYGLLAEWLVHRHWPADDALPAEPPSPVVDQLPHLVVDLDRRRVFLGPQEIDPGPQGYRFLACLIEHSGHVVDRQTVAAAVWPQDQHEDGIGDGRLDALVHRLRDQLGRHGARYIQTRRGRGWILDLDLARAADQTRPNDHS
jgi:DNA-binding response OmpR family regulator